MSEQSTPQPKARLEKIWDPLVRIAHWGQAIAVFYLLFADPIFPIHAQIGYVILGIIIVRTLWGFIGTRYARFSAFSFGIAETWQYTKAALKFGHAKEYASHNPMGALMVYAFLLWIPLTCILGIMLYATQQMLGPLEGYIPVDWDLTLEELHYFSADALLVMVIIHVIGVAWASWWHRENYLKAMFTGYKNKFRRRSKRTTAADRKT